MCRSGSWSCSDWKSCSPEYWSITHIKNYIERILLFTIGYKFENVLNSQKLWNKVILVNTFDWLKKIQYEDSPSFI